MDPGARREIQMLRAEILELEDQYYALKSRCGDDDSVSVADAGSSSSRYYCPDCGTYHDYAPDSRHGTNVAPATENWDSNPSSVTPATRKPDSSSQPESIDLNIEEPQSRNLPRSGSTSRISRTSTEQRRSLNETVGDLLGSGDGSNAAPMLAADGQDFLFAIETTGSNGSEPSGMFVTITERQILDHATKVEVSLMNPFLPNGQQRIGYWNFDQGQIARSNRTSMGARELRLFVPAAELLNSSDTLLTFVRVQLDDGRKFVSSQDLLPEADTGMPDLTASDTTSANLKNAPTADNGSLWRQAR
jgi:hypothetical protein